MNLFFRRSNYIQTSNHSELWVITFTSSSDIYLFIYLFEGGRSGNGYWFCFISYWKEW